jgi:hypothetical protein
MRPVGWLYVLSAVGSLIVLAYMLYATEPFHFGWSNIPPEYNEMLYASLVPLAVSAFCATVLLKRTAPSTRSRALILALSVIACVALLLKGWGLLLFLLAPPTALLAVRAWRVGA